MFTETKLNYGKLLFPIDHVRYFDSGIMFDEKLESLRELVIKLYSKQWHTKLKNATKNILEIKMLAKLIIQLLNIQYIESTKYYEDNLNVDF